MTGLIFRPKLGTPLGVSQQLPPIRELFRPDDALLQPLDGSWCNHLGTATCLALVPINSSIVLLIFSTIDEAVARTTIARGRAKQPQQQLVLTVQCAQSKVALAVLSEAFTCFNKPVDKHIMSSHIG